MTGPVAPYYSQQIITANGLEAGRVYDFYILAINAQGSTSSNAISAGTNGADSLNNPDLPGFSSIASTEVTAVMPALPAGALTMDLQRRAPGGQDQDYVNCATGLSGGAEVTVSGLSAGTKYEFRCVARNNDGTRFGNSIIIETAQATNDIGLPTFSNVTFSSVRVTSPTLPQGAEGLILEAKLQGQPDSAYGSVFTDPKGGLYTDILGLLPQTTYEFRYRAVNQNTIYNGPSATVTTSAPAFVWSAGSAIECAGIQDPAPNAGIAGGTAGYLRSFVAADDDLRYPTGQTQNQGEPTTDTCIYTWTASAGTFQDNINSGRAVVWIAPTTPGTVTLTLTITDQNDANKPTTEGGSRHDQAVQFTTQVQVQ